MMKLDLTPVYDRLSGDDETDTPFPLAVGIFNILKATLEYPVPVRTKAARLASDIVFCCEESDPSLKTGDEEEDGKHTTDGGTLWMLWTIITELAATIPSGHQWQESLVQGLVLLQERDDATPTYDDSLLPMPWKEMSDFGMEMRRKHDSLWGALGKGDFAVDADRWKKFHSFAARLSATGVPMLHVVQYGMDQMIELLEDEPQRPIPRNSEHWNLDVWLVTEWIIHDGKSLFDCITSAKEGEIYGAGKLCREKNIPAVSIERWRFWRSRLSGFVAQAEVLELEAATVGRINEAIERMEDIESQSGQGAVADTSAIRDGVEVGAGVAEEKKKAGTKVEEAVAKEDENVASHQKMTGGSQTAGQD